MDKKVKLCEVRVTAKTGDECVPEESVMAEFIGWYSRPIPFMRDGYMEPIGLVTVLQGQKKGENMMLSPDKIKFTDGLNS